MVPMRRLLSILLEGTGVTLFGCGIVATLLFFSTESRVELASRGSKIPDECEAVFWNHGGYACWYTIQDHPFGLPSRSAHLQPELELSLGLKDIGLQSGLEPAA